MKRPDTRLFLERQSYRRRRLRDAARLLPVLGLVLFCAPVLIRDGESVAPLSTDGALIYFFVVWAGLILVAAGLARVLGRDDGPH